MKKFGVIFQYELMNYIKNKSYVITTVIIALVAILLTTILILIMMSVAKSKSKEDWLMEDAEQSECVRRMIKEREKKKAGKAL